MRNLWHRWPQIKGDPYFDKINGLPKFVASTTLRKTTWNSTLINGDVAEEISKLKNQAGKNIMKYGTTGLDYALIKHNLVDELRLFVLPTVVGKGRRLFEGFDAADLKLTLTGTTRFRNGVVLLCYIPEWAVPLRDEEGVESPVKSVYSNA